MSNNEEMLKGTVGSLFDGMKSFLSTKSVVGEPIYVGDTVIIPIINVSFGMGAGSYGNGGGGGIGGKMTPNAVLVIRDGKTKLIDIASTNGISKLLDMVPDFVDTFKNRGKAKERSAAENQAREEAAEEITETIRDAVEE